MDVTGYFNQIDRFGIFIPNSLVFDMSMSNLTIKDSSFNNIQSRYSSPVVYITNEDPTQKRTQVIILNSTFTNNIARLDAGVLQAKNSDVFINKSRFENNTARQGNAGVIQLTCDEDFTFKCSYDIEDSLFFNNKANIDGGVFKYDYYKPVIGSNNFFGNNTAQYGPIVASYPIELSLMHSGDQNRRRILSLLNQTQVTKLGLGNGIVYGFNDKLVSGKLIKEEILITIMDDGGNIMITDNTTSALVSPLNENDNIQILKSKQVTAVQGTIKFNDFIVVAQPGKDIILQIQCDSINKDKIHNAFGINFQDIYLYANMRLCIRGEYQSNDNKCVECPDGFFQLLDNQTKCLDCPDNAVCQEGFKIIPVQGYWRKDVNSTDLFQCYLETACLPKYDDACASGYGGNLCQSCVKYDNQWYSRQDSNGCQECIEYSLNVTRLSFVAIFIVAYFILLLGINIRTAGQHKVTTVYMRILTNYIQLLTLAQSYDLSCINNHYDICVFASIDDTVIFNVEFIPIIVIEVIGLPLIMLTILYQRRNQLQEKHNLTRYGFLYVGLSNEAFYWEILIHLRKVAMISINVFFASFKPIYRALIGFIVLIFYIEALQKIEPYKTASINELEFKANIAAYAVFYGGLFFIYSDNTSTFSILLFVAIVTINLYFWASWFSLMFEKQYDKMRAFINKYICKLKNTKPAKSKIGIAGKDNDNSHCNSNRDGHNAKDQQSLQQDEINNGLGSGKYADNKIHKNKKDGYNYLNDVSQNNSNFTKNLMSDLDYKKTLMDQQSSKRKKERKNQLNVSERQKMHSKQTSNSNRIESKTRQKGKQRKQSYSSDDEVEDLNKKTMDSRNKSLNQSILQQRKTNSTIQSPNKIDHVFKDSPYTTKFQSVLTPQMMQNKIGNKKSKNKPITSKSQKDSPSFQQKKIKTENTKDPSLFGEASADYVDQPVRESSEGDSSQSESQDHQDNVDIKGASNLNKRITQERQEKNSTLTSGKTKIYAFNMDQKQSSTSIKKNSSKDKTLNTSEISDEKEVAEDAFHNNKEYSKFQEQFVGQKKASLSAFNSPFRNELNQMYQNEGLIYSIKSKKAQNNLQKKQSRNRQEEKKKAYQSAQPNEKLFKKVNKLQIQQTHERKKAEGLSDISSYGEEEPQVENQQQQQPKVKTIKKPAQDQSPEIFQYNSQQKKEKKSHLSQH